MRSRKLALVIAPFLLLSMLPGVAIAAGPSEQAQSRAEVLKYWTPERMKSAKWLTVEVDRSTKEGRLVPRSAATVGESSNGDFWPASATDDVTRGTGRVYFAFGRATEAWHAWALFLTYGVFFGLTEGTERAMVADLVERQRRGTAFGWYNLAIGIGALPASLLFGFIWERVSPTMAFDVGALLAVLAAVLLLAVRASGPAEA